MYKSFKTIEEAEKFITGEKVFTGEKSITGMKASRAKSTSESDEKYSTYAFVDGSFNKATHTYGYGGFLVTDNENTCCRERMTMPRWPQCANVAGEIKARRLP